MIGTILRIGFINLRRDRVAQALTFLLPVMFFSIFASVFGNQRDSTSRIAVPVVDEEQSEYSKQLVKALAAEGGLRVQTTKARDGSGGDLTRADVEGMVRGGGFSVGIIFPKGFSAGSLWQREPSAPKVQLLADVSDPVAPQMVLGLLQKVSFTAAPDVMASEGMGMLEKYGGPLTPQQRESMAEWKKLLNTQAQDPSAASAAGGQQVGLPVEMVNLMEPGGDSQPTVSFYAAGIGVMFLLFSVTGAGGSLLEEVDSGTLGRLIGSKAGMSGMLTGKWLFLVIMGVLQLTVMFVWGALVFGLPLWSHLPGFFTMTIFTAASAAAFGLLLATISRTRAQLSGISTIVILAMSAIGGSMFPRFLMSEGMQQMGLVTFNAWALDGYIKVFWREAPIVNLWPQLLVLTGLCAAFLMGARLAARRWETL